MQSAGKKSIFLRVYKHYNRSFSARGKIFPLVLFPTQVPSFGLPLRCHCVVSRRAPQCQAMSFAAPPVGRAVQPYGLINHKNQISDISFYFEGGMVMRNEIYNLI